MTEFRKLPPALQEVIDKYSWERNTVHGTAVDVFKLTNNGFPSLYLKINPSLPGMSLQKEAKKLEWLSGKLPVPKVLNFIYYDSKEYLLLTEIKGIPSFLTPLAERKETISLLARGLLRIHSLNITGCPFDNSLDVQLERALERMKHGLVDKDEFDAIRQGRNVESLYKELLARKPSDEDLVFTHGDYCLPNILIHRDRVSGFIDMGNAGISDRYQDVALCARSIAYNFGEKWIPLFLQEYGLKSVNWDKMDYYQLLDEFF